MINFGVTERKRQGLDRRMHNCNLLENDIEEKFVRSSGAGGQKVNKSSTWEIKGVRYIFWVEMVERKFIRIVKQNDRVG